MLCCKKTTYSSVFYYTHTDIVNVCCPACVRRIWLNELAFCGVRVNYTFLLCVSFVDFWLQGIGILSKIQFERIREAFDLKLLSESTRTKILCDAHYTIILRHLKVRSVSIQVRKTLAFCLIILNVRFVVSKHRQIISFQKCRRILIFLPKSRKTNTQYTVIIHEDHLTVVGD